ncbi:MAG: hypothetical protein NC923_05695 [Candidatus Omnitrophica bacterium]|nr:hypothetical protein [Candidatus Omnitrophota bacterium]
MEAAHMPAIFLCFFKVALKNAIRIKAPQVKTITLWNPIKISLITISVSGTITEYFLFRYTPLNIAIAATGVKLGK